MVKADDSFIEALHSWTRANDALLCFDEVICFRVDYEGAQALFNVKPDLTSMGKIIGGGFPIGAFAGRDDIMKILNPGDQNFRFALSGTFSANPISMIAGKVAMEMLDRDALDKLNIMAEIAKNQIHEAGKIADIPLSITGCASMFKVHFKDVPPRSYRDVYENDQTKKIIKMFLEHLYAKGVIIINSCSCILSTVITQKEVDILSDAMLSAFRFLKPHLDK